MLVESYGVRPEHSDAAGDPRLGPRETYTRDQIVYWGFLQAGLERLARIAGFSGVQSLTHAEVDGHPRIIAKLVG